MMSMSVCLSVSLSVCPRGYLENHVSELHQIFYAFVRGRGLFSRGGVAIRCVLLLSTDYVMFLNTGPMAPCDTTAAASLQSRARFNTVAW